MTPVRISLFVLAALFTLAGALHFARPGMYVRIMPPWLPWHRELVYLSGACEILGGLGLLYGPTRRAAGIGLILLLIAVWPANVQMLMNARDAAAALWWQALLWVRLPLQLALIAWVWWAAVRS